MNTLVLTDVDFYPVIQPILEILDAILWPAIAIVVAVGTIYCIFLGVKISKADEQNSREKAKEEILFTTFDSAIAEKNLSFGAMSFPVTLIRVFLASIT